MANLKNSRTENGAVQAAEQNGQVADFDQYVSLRIRQRRIMLGLTYEQMAELIGVTSQQYYKYESGVNQISAGRLYQIARSIGVKIGYFFDDIELVAGRKVSNRYQPLK